MKSMAEINENVDSNLQKIETDEAMSRAMASANDEYYIDEMLARQSLDNK